MISTESDLTSIDNAATALGGIAGVIGGIVAALDLTSSVGGGSA